MRKEGPANGVAQDGTRDGGTCRCSPAAPGIRVFGDRVQPGADLSSTAGWVSDGIQQLADFARPAGVEVWLESHGAFASARETLSVVRASGCVNTGVVWDPLNAYSEFGEEPVTGWRRAWQGLPVTFHIKDGIRIHSSCAQRTWEPVMVGDGDFPALALVALLREQGYRQFISFEWEKRWHPRLFPLAEIALPRFMRWMRTAMES